MLSAHEDALVKASVIKFFGRRKSNVETGDVSGQEKENQEAMMGLGPKPKEPAPKNPMYEKVDEIYNARFGDNSSDDSQTDPGIMGAARDIGSRALGGAKKFLGGVKDKVMGTDGIDARDAEMNQKFNKLTGGDPNADPEGVFQGTPGMASQVGTKLGSKWSGLKDSIGNTKQWLKDQGADKLSTAKQGFDNRWSGLKDSVGNTKQWLKDQNEKYNTPENRESAIRGAANVLSLPGQIIAGAGEKLGDLGGRMAYGKVDPATGQRTGRGASGFINPNDKLGTLGAGLYGAVTGKGAMNTIEERNERLLSTPTQQFDREAQAKVKQGAADFDASQRWANMPMNVQAGAANKLGQGMQPPGGNAMSTAGTNTMSTAGTNTMSTDGSQTGTPGDADGNGVPDVEETQTTSTDGTTGEVTQTTERKVTPQQGNQQAQNILAQRHGQQLQEADKRAQTSGGLGLSSLGGLAANALTMGGVAAGKGLYNAYQRHQGRKDQAKHLGALEGMAQENPTFTASFDSPVDDLWELQKMMQTFRLRDSTEALRHAYR